MKNIFLSLFAFALLFACETESIYNEADLLGTWDCYKWDVNGEMNNIPKGKVNFTFEQDKYVYKGGAHKEQGTWKIQGMNLVTQEEGLLAKEVEIKRMSQDTLIFNMVDNGTPMTMYLNQ